SPWMRLLMSRATTSAASSASWASLTILSRASARRRRPNCGSSMYIRPAPIPTPANSEIARSMVVSFLAKFAYDAWTDHGYFVQITCLLLPGSDAYLQRIDPVLVVGGVVKIGTAGRTAVLAGDDANQIEGHLDLLLWSEVAPVENKHGSAQFPC